MHTLTIILPIPPRVLNENVHVPHWAIRSRAVKAYKAAAYFAMLNAINRNSKFCQALPLDFVRIVPTMFFATKRRRDDDNWTPALKAYRDGIAKAGVVVDDEFITTLPPALKVNKQRPRVELLIQEIVSESSKEETDDA